MIQWCLVSPYGAGILSVVFITSVMAIIAHVMPRDAGFVDIFIGPIHNENGDQIQ